MKSKTSLVVLAGFIFTLGAYGCSESVDETVSQLECRAGEYEPREKGKEKAEIEFWCDKGAAFDAKAETISRVLKIDVTGASGIQKLNDSYYFQVDVRRGKADTLMAAYSKAENARPIPTKFVIERDETLE